MELPDDVVRETLPRVVVAVTESAYPFEQAEADVDQPSATCMLVVSVLVEGTQRGLGEAVAARVRDLMVSTPVVGPTIIGARLAPEGQRRPVREVAFRNAWRLTAGFRAQHVGVLS